ncbi:SDR family oxidoreductase [Acidisoma silvae]|uniref:SDR family oxidoreductase n=1 Tax=Acidisoma silvae TaxID=2802396 RepID=A0A963YTN3_9PROT|nr:SDR family oxidoreductase [Acidisoma silvae]MCB8876769.1 SDR family oxidoreductase [Acidisoma silvae]
MLDGKIILITGGGSGIGAAAAEGAARDGAKVVVADISEAAAKRVAASCGGDAMTVDVRDSLSVQALVRETVARHGRIDGLFHTAMSVPLVNKNDRRVTELPESVWDDIITLVLTGTFLVSKYVAKQMLTQPGGGSLVLTATADALIGQAGLDAYTAAKGGVISMTRSMAAGLSPEGVRINAICPGFVDTPHQREFLEVPALRARIESLQLMPVMTAMDAAELGLFLLSDRARYQTGGIHVCDSGYSAFKGKLDVLEVFDRASD